MVVPSTTFEYACLAYPQCNTVEVLGEVTYYNNQRIERKRYNMVGEYVLELKCTRSNLKSTPIKIGENTKDLNCH